MNARRRLIRSLILVILLALLLSWATGCVSHTPSIPPSPLHPHTPESLKHVDSALGWLIVLSVFGVGAGVALFFLIPAEHRISIGITAGAGAALALSLLLKVSLWMIPWAAGALMVMGLTFIGYKLYQRAKEKRSDLR